VVKNPILLIQSIFTSIQSI